MFVQAIEMADAFTRPIHSISRVYGSTIVEPGAATLFFVNSDGWALTCRHVAHQIAAGEQLAAKRSDFEAELRARRGQKKQKQLLRELEQKYKCSRNAPFELHNRFVSCIQGDLKLQMLVHGSLDVALIQFQNFQSLRCHSFPTFAANGSDLKQGKFLCRLGFPFPEFDNFRYDVATETICWTNDGKTDTPRFPIEGMVTRHLADDTGQVVGFELSTPGLRGQSGGPAFDSDGRIWGMQFGTAHLDLNFDIDQDLVRNGQKKRVKDSAFLHVGRCVHVNVMKEFMTQHGVQFQEG